VIDFSLTEEQQLLRDTIVKFAKNELNDGVIERDQNHEFRRDLWDKCGELGLQGLCVPEELGGMGLDPISTVIALEALGYGSRDSGLNFSICAHLLACVVPIWKHGNAEQQARYLPDLCAGRQIAVNAMTESETGSDAFAMTTRAIPKDSGGFVITGTKSFNSNAPIADVAVLYASTDPNKGFMGGITAFLIDLTAPGISRGQTYNKLGLRTSPIGELVLNEVPVTADAVLGSVGGGGNVFTDSMDWERACLIACHVGTMQRLLEEAIDYARTRRQFNQPIGKYQAVSHKIADMKIRLEASRLMVYRAAFALANQRSASLEASAAKVFVSEALLQTALDTVQVFGGNGFMTEYGVESAVRDAVGGKIYSGTSEMQRNIIALWLGL
jgi:alkylation response protein AidB-like acyl-CoA dehydrogenase